MNGNCEGSKQAGQGPARRWGDAGEFTSPARGGLRPSPVRLTRAFGLLRNEVEKILRRRRFRVVLLILLALAGLVTYGERRGRLFREHERGGAAADWHAGARERLIELEGRSRRSGRWSPVYQRSLQAQIARLRYHLDHDIDPEAPTAVGFMRGFATASSYLLLPLLVAIFASDLVSVEFTEGTIKLLLTRPVARWKILTAKLAAMVTFVTLTVLASGFIAWAVSGLSLGWRGWNAPTLSGFRYAAGALDVEAVRLLPLWQDVVIVYGLAWFAAIIVGCLTFMLSTLLRSAAATMGTMLATLIGGTILPRLANDWDLAKYLFVTNLPLPEFYSGTPPPFPGMTLAFSVTVLAGWGLAALVVAYVVFTRRDVLA